MGLFWWSLGALLGLSGGSLGVSWGLLAVPWGCLGGLLGLPGGILGCSWGALGLMSLFGPSWPPSWAKPWRFSLPFWVHFWAHFGLILGPVFSFVLGVLFARLLGRCSGPEAAQAGARRRPEASRRGDFAAIYDGFGMSPLLLLSGLLGPSCSPLGAKLASQSRLLDPKRVPK